MEALIFKSIGKKNNNKYVNRVQTQNEIMKIKKYN